MIIALSGGVGGAKLALGLSRIMPPENLLVVVNTGDDFEHLGLSISPDIDTVVYTLAGLANREVGWGRHDETWSFMETMEALGGETWFRLGDRDVALHVERTRRLRRGETLSAVTADMCMRLGVGTARGADDRRSGADPAADRTRVAGFPGIFRPPALRAGGERVAVPGRRSGHAASGVHRRAGGSSRWRQW